MPPVPKHWDIAPVAPKRQFDRLSHLNSFLVQILYNRGVTDPEEVDAFLNGRSRFDDPFRLLGVPEAVERIRAAWQAGERIVVYGDFDADGVTATASWCRRSPRSARMCGTTSRIVWTRATA